MLFFLFAFSLVEWTLSFQYSRVQGGIAKTRRTLENKNVFLYESETNDFDATNKFSIETAVFLAEYAFKSYSEPKAGKWQNGRKSTRVGFQSALFVRQVFRGLLMVTVQKAALPFYEKQLIESFTTGTEIDPYIVMQIEELQATTDLVDIARTTTKPRSLEPEWQETFQLYVQDPETSVLKITVMDEDSFSEDDEVAIAAPLRLKEIVENLDPMDPRDSWVEAVPLYVNLTNVNIGAKRSASLNLEIRYFPFDIFGVETLEEDEESFCKTPTNDTLADWKGLCNQVGGLALDTDEFEHIAFVENTDTDTQVGIWRDQKRKEIIIAFRGTEQIKWRDFLTDIDIVQEPWDWDETSEKSQNADVLKEFYTNIDKGKTSINELKQKIEDSQLGWDDLYQSFAEKSKRLSIDKIINAIQNIYSNLQDNTQREKIQRELQNLMKGVQPSEALIAALTSSFQESQKDLFENILASQSSLLEDNLKKIPATGLGDTPCVHRGF